MGIAKMLGSRSFFWGIGVAALSFILFPKAKEKVKPVLVNSMKSTYNMADKASSVINKGKDRIAKMFNDNETNDMEDENLYQSEIDSLEEEREKAVKEVNELKNRIEMLESQLSRLKTVE
ncbi:hypothetical protein Q2T46_12190 [Thermoanaerobacterium sp. CMT5567-10]|uniref:hypothetical protein n=1 Tax=Thermoanaerobacterium sp. CMT5567-10 TaxID=3061989 RepID=UPI0026DEB913|nr:hypothetical protein [Thermoanaerobacterium sp. CMT5567-10]MDK2804999.1 hypothetical protein [Thermoanaerobacterium sp.]WKV08285.1 hypothetical protein Q2T46_12190 [Thermoanaerobacterium sp. CMT5567-10]